MHALGVVNLFELRRPCRYIDEGFVPGKVHLLDLERLRKALGLSVVVGVGRRAHRTDQLEPRQGSPIFIARVLTATITVVDAGVRSMAPVGERRFQRGQRELCVDVPGDGVADHLAAARVQNGRQITEAGCDPDVRDVRYSHHVWPGRNDVAVEVGKTGKS